MRKSAVVLCIAGLSLLFLGNTSAQAGAKIKISDDSDIDLGFRLQTLFISTGKDLNSDGKFETFNDFKVRRGRIRLGANVTKWTSYFLQTEFAEDAATGADMRIIDAFIILKPHDLFNIYVGENMAPSSRQATTSSGALMAMDRATIVYKSLTWGTRALSAFANNTVSDTDAGLRGNVDVRDMGVTIFGKADLAENAHVKYYLGAYDGVQLANTKEDSERIAGRVQVNFFDSEPGYYNLSTYLGKKKTIGIGASFDTQSDVAVDLATGSNVDYSLYSFDVFADYPAGPGTVTFEAGYTNLDLDGATQLNFNGNGTSFKDARTSQGKGYYAQAGYYINQWQPWIEYETWESDGLNDKGSYKITRFGLSYFIKGHNANIKAGYEIFKSDQNFTGTTEDTLGSFVLGAYMTY